ncbi:MAG: metalloregulator ArsR/SmtB family transcription factor [Pseudomonadota bacterium]
MDAVFKALNDPTRRRILDLLREKDGRTLNALVEALDGMTRFGVMKHLKVLEDASLVVARRSGRFKHHYLNAVPLQTVLDRWIEPFRAKPLARLALDLKTQLERNADMTEAKPDFVLETFIKTRAATLWEALTQPDHIARYYIMGAKPAAPIAGTGRTSYDGPDGEALLGGEVLAFDPPRRLEMTFEPHWGEDRTATRMVYEIEERGDLCKLTILHFDLPAAQDGVREGWALIASSLKTLLETGDALPMAS